MKGTHEEYAQQLDAALLEGNIARNRYFTPQDLMKCTCLHHFIILDQYDVKKIDQPTAATLGDAAALGWPTLGEMKGKVLCVLSGDEEEFKVAYAQTDMPLCFADSADEVDTTGKRVFVNVKIKKEIVRRHVDVYVFN